MIAGLCIAYFWFRPVSPKIEITLSPQWVAGRPTVCILAIKIANLSKIRVIKADTVLQVLLHPVSQLPQLSEWVPFAQERIRPNEEPPIWTKPVAVLQSTQNLDHGESVTVERPIVLPNTDTIAHVGIKFSAKLSRGAAFFSLYLKRRVEWTRTAFVVPPRHDSARTTIGRPA